VNNEGIRMQKETIFFSILRYYRAFYWKDWGAQRRILEKLTGRGFNPGPPKQEA
jgi:hypothetical protein